MREMKGPDYYDWLFTEVPNYQKSADDAPWSPVWKTALELIPRYASRILDLGCGAGHFAELAVRAGYQVEGVDWSEKGIETCRARVPEATFYHDDIRRVAKKMGARVADCVTMLEVLEHIDDDIALVASLPGRIPLVYSVPNFDSESHVRVFQSAQEAAIRYAPYLEVYEVRTVRYPSGSEVYVVQSSRRPLDGA